MALNAKVLNMAANVFLVAASGLLGTAAWYRYFHVPPTNASKSAGAVPFRPGDRAPQIRGIDYASAQRSLVIFLSTTCHYCEASAPFYNKLHAVAEGTNGKWKFFTVFSQPGEQVQAFKARLNLAAYVLPGVEFRSFGVHSTPTAILVGKTGVVDRVWLGTSEAIETDVVAALTR